MARPPSVQDYYNTAESRVGYQLLLGGIRHFGYYEHDSYWPFPITKALKAMEEHMYQRLGLKSNALVLDAGCGAGFVANYMAARGLRVEAIDITHLHVRLAKENVKKAKTRAWVNVSQGSYESLDFADEHFDGVYTMETVGHAHDPDRAFREFYRVLKPGGVVVHHEYEQNILEKGTPRDTKAFRDIVKNSSLHAFQEFRFGTISKRLGAVGFQDVEVEDLSQNIRPLYRLFLVLAYIPYLIIQFFRLEARFVNAMAGVEGYRWQNNLKYLSIKARKPGGQ